MAITLQTNPTGLIARQNFSDNVFSLSASVHKLSSGLRINKIADDPIAVSLAGQLNSQTLGLGQAVKNANDGVSSIQVVDNSLNEARGLLDLIQSKAVAATHDDQNVAPRASLQSDINKLLTELDQLIDSATFHDISLLKSTYTNKTFQVGAASGQTLPTSLPAATQYQIGANGTGACHLASSVGGLVHLELINQANNEAISANSASLSSPGNNLKIKSYRKAEFFLYFSCRSRSVTEYSGMQSRYDL